MDDSIGDYLRAQRQWSEATFGPNRRTAGCLKHIRKELDEIERDPTDLIEWVDVMILALDGYWRHGGTPESLAHDLSEKQKCNRNRTWPPYDPTKEDEPVEHDRTHDSMPS